MSTNRFKSMTSALIVVLVVVASAGWAAAQAGLSGGGIAKTPDGTVWSNPGAVTPSNPSVTRPPVSGAQQPSMNYPPAGRVPSGAIPSRPSVGVQSPSASGSVGIANSPDGTVWSKPGSGGPSSVRPPTTSYPPTTGYRPPVTSYPPTTGYPSTAPYRPGVARPSVVTFPSAPRTGGIANVPDGTVWFRDGHRVYQSTPVQDAYDYRYWSDYGPLSVWWGYPTTTVYGFYSPEYDGWYSNDLVSYRTYTASPYRTRHYVSYPWYTTYYYWGSPYLTDSAVMYAPGFVSGFQWQDGNDWRVAFSYGFGSGIRLGELSWVWSWYPYGGHAKVSAVADRPVAYTRYVGPRVVEYSTR